MKALSFKFLFENYITTWYRCLFEYS